jgi:hypothetical protein
VEKGGLLITNHPLLSLAHLRIGHFTQFSPPESELQPKDMCAKVEKGGLVIHSAIGVPSKVYAPSQLSYHLPPHKSSWFPALSPLTMSSSDKLLIL